MEKITLIFDSKPISTLTKIPEDINIILYPTVESVLKESWGGEDITDSTFGFMNPDGSETDQEMDVDELCRNIKRCGIWGCVNNDGTIHMWIDKDVATKEDILSFFAHEIGHLHKPAKKDFLEEEMKAERYSDITKCAYQLYKAVAE